MWKQDKEGGREGPQGGQERGREGRREEERGRVGGREGRREGGREEERGREGEEIVMGSQKFVAKVGGGGGGWSESAVPYVPSHVHTFHYSTAHEKGNMIVCKVIGHIHCKYCDVYHQARNKY